MRTARWIDRVWRRRMSRLMARNVRWVAETREIQPLWTDWADQAGMPPCRPRRRGSDG
jgi:hypothetical protein